MSTKLFGRVVGFALGCAAIGGAMGCKDKQKEAETPEAPATEDSGSKESPIKKGAADVGEGATEAWDGMKEGGKDVGKGAAKIGKKIGAGASTAAKDVAAGTKKAGHDIGEGVSEGVDKAKDKKDDKDKTDKSD
jgi:hypothetical protein